MKKKFLLVAMATLMLTACGDNSNEGNTQPTSTGEITSTEVTTEKASDEMSDNKQEASTTPTDNQASSSTYKPNGTTPQEIIDVILNDAEFIYIPQEHDSEELGFKTKTVKMSEFNYWNGSILEEIITLGSYRVVDLDNDGFNEVISEAYTDQLLVFHYEDGSVYGFDFNFRGMNPISTEGVMSGSGGASSSVEYRVDFNKDTYTETIIAEIDGDNCHINGKRVTTDEYYDYSSKELYKDTVPSWSDYSLLKETVTKVSDIRLFYDTPDTYVPNGRTPQALADVILNDAEFINTDNNNSKATLSSFKYEESDEETYEIRRYYVIDLDDDGINEIVTYGKMESVLIFHYEDGAVYSFKRPFRGTVRISINGIVEGSNSAAYTSYYKIDFNKDTYTESNVFEWADDARYVDGVDVTSDLYYEYCKLIYIEEATYFTQLSELNEVIERERAYDLKASNYTPNGNTPDAIKEVIFNNAEFVDMGNYDFTNKTTTLSAYKRFNQSVDINKYTVIDLDGDDNNEVIAYYGDVIPLAIIFTYDGEQVKGMSLLANMVQNISADGVFMYHTPLNETYSYKYEFSDSYHLKKRVLCHHYYDENNQLICTIQDEEANPNLNNDGYIAEDEDPTVDAVEYSKYYDNIWDDTIPFFTDLSLLKAMK